MLVLAGSQEVIAALESGSRGRSDEILKNVYIYDRAVDSKHHRQNICQYNLSFFTEKKLILTGFAATGSFDAIMG
jgi:hypothetical protein